VDGRGIAMRLVAVVAAAADMTTMTTNTKNDFDLEWLWFSWKRAVGRVSKKMTSDEGQKIADED